MRSRKVLERLQEEFPEWDHYIESESGTSLCDVTYNDGTIDDYYGESYSTCVGVREKDGIVSVHDWLSDKEAYNTGFTVTRESLNVLFRLQELIDEEYGDEGFVAHVDKVRGYA